MPKQNQKNEQKFSIFGQSDVGMRCMINSDCIEFDQTKGIAILTDGLEQSEAGKISAKLAAKSVFEGLQSDTFTNDLSSSNEEQVLNAIDKLISKTNQVLIDASTAVGEGNYMRTTIVAILIQKRKIFLGHVGDSRVYLLRNNILGRLTRDHSLVHDLVSRGVYHQRKQKSSSIDSVTRVLGAKPNIEITTLAHEIKSGDRLLLCSDGLSDMLSDKEIEEIANTEIHNLKKTTKNLIKFANRRGGRDNISVILAQIP